MRAVVSSSILVLLLTGCWEFDGPVEPEPQPEGTSGVSGRLLVLGGESTGDDALIAQQRENLAAAFATDDDDTPAPAIHPSHRPYTLGDLAPELPRAPEWRPGELIIGYETGRFTKHALTAILNDLIDDTAHHALDAQVTLCTARRFCLVKVGHGPFDDEGRPQKPASLEATQALETLLHPKRPDGVRYIAANYLKYATRVPNDPLYVIQDWHYSFPGLPAAWDISTGDPNLVIAVVDSGIVVSHPELINRTVPGADIIEDANVANDGDGRDLNPNDDAGQYHGTHVAGTIGAETNNGNGASGVTWQGSIQAVRVLGQGLSGSTFDVLSGLYWAIGDPDVDDVPPNATPAKVVNLSLGGPLGGNDYTSWAEEVEYIIDTAPDQYGNPIIIAAAGNENQNADNITPASLPQIITVGAHRYDGLRTTYSNWGNSVDIMAPGGQMEVDQNGDAYPDGILSLWANEYDFEEGTSMATPHVSGIAGLILAVDPNIDQNAMKTLLRSTADPAGVCAEGCGTGHIDASAALLAAGGVSSPTPQLAADRTRLIFGVDQSYREVNVLNIGEGLLEYNVEVIGAQAALFSAEIATGSLQTGQVYPLGVSLSRNGFVAGSANLKLSGYGDAAGQEVYIDLAFSDEQANNGNNLIVAQVGAYTRLENGTYQSLVPPVLARADDGFSYEITGLFPGDVFVLAVGDDNNDGTFDTDNESFGAWPVGSNPQFITVEEDTMYTEVNFGLRGGYTDKEDGYVGSSCQVDGDCSFASDGTCITEWQGGYCSRVCDDGFCGPGASCEILDCGGTPCNVCLATCAGASSCRTGDGYTCDPFNTCTPVGF